MQEANPGDLVESIEILMDALLDAAEEDPEVRESLHVVRDWIGERLDELEDDENGAERPRGRAARSSSRSRGGRDWGGGGAGRRDPPGRRRSSEEIDLDLVRQRAMIKSESCRFASMRRRLLARGADPETEIDPHYKDLVGRAKALPGCYAWPLDSNRQLPGDNELELLARCYENVAYGVELAQRAVSHKGSEGTPGEELLYLLAESQSALRAALSATDLRNDEDQIQTYIWVKEQAYDQETYVSRFMRVEDPADPLRWGDLRQRMEAFNQKLAVDSEEEDERREMLAQVRSDLEGAAANPDSEESWSKVFEGLDDWVDAGRPAASRELCQMVMPWLAMIPDEAQPSDNARQVLAAAQRMRDAREARAAARAH